MNDMEIRVYLEEADVSKDFFDCKENNLKCPFCQQELEINDLDVQLLGCENQNCKHSIHYDTVGSKELWQELIKLMEEKQHKNTIDKWAEQKDVK